MLFSSRRGRNGIRLRYIDAVSVFCYRLRRGAELPATLIIQLAPCYSRTRALDDIARDVMKARRVAGPGQPFHNANTPLHSRRALAADMCVDGAHFPVVGG